MGDLDFVDVRLWKADAVALFDWLLKVDLDRVPVEHPAQRQALADLFGRLGHVLDVPSNDQLHAAFEELTRHSD
ncbi:MAG TPA: hypothetical protein VIL36_15615 [Acidimicrobiales bacterium]